MALLTGELSKANDFKFAIPGLLAQIENLGKSCDNEITLGTECLHQYLLTSKQHGHQERRINIHRNLSEFTKLIKYL